ncbi:KptA family-domain-containing protein [Mycena rosella]|uniref:KptA family-domain-containing protein n=1 Tax=Mycena rosella TaxID=1033263 RepID=A0AAD7MBH7_MYCRO|nr:KptA family-domain-containing protein [Mycena rosella]
MNLYRNLPRILQAPKYCGRRLITTEREQDPRDDGAARFEFFTTRLNYLLRYAAVKEEIEIRPDGYVRLDDVRDWRLFRYLTPAEFNTMIDNEALTEGNDRFTLIQDFDLRAGADSIWIRAKKKHSMQSVHVNTQKIISPAKLPMAVYPLNLKEWEHVARRGIPRNEEDGFIHLIPTTPAHNFVGAAGANSDVCIYLDVPQTLAAGIGLFRHRRLGRILTNGNLDGVLPPALFKEVGSSLVTSGPRSRALISCDSHNPASPLAFVILSLKDSVTQLLQAIHKCVKRTSPTQIERIAPRTVRLLNIIFIHLSFVGLNSNADSHSVSSILRELRPRAVYSAILIEPSRRSKLNVQPTASRYKPEERTNRRNPPSVTPTALLHYTVLP